MLKMKNNSQQSGTNEKALAQRDLSCPMPQAPAACPASCRMPHASALAHNFAPLRRAVPLVCVHLQQNAFTRAGSCLCVCECACVRACVYVYMCVPNKSSCVSDNRTKRRAMNQTPLCHRTDRKVHWKTEIDNS